MTREEIEQAIQGTKIEIYRAKEQLERVTDPRKEKQLLARLKELQIRQMWWMDQLKAPW